MTPLRKDFLRHSLLATMALLFSLLLTIAGVVKLHALQQVGAGLYARQQSAQRLHAEVQTLGALAGRLPLTISIAEANTLAELTESQWQAIADVLVTLEQTEDMADTMALVRKQTNKVHQLLAATMTTVIENRRAKTTPENTLGVERNLVRLLHAEAVQLATYASSASADLTAAFDQQSLLTERMTHALGGLILLSGLIGVLAVRTQFKLLDRRIIRRIESLSEQMANDTILEHLKQVPTTFNDEIDLMHDELVELLVRLDEQKNTLELMATTDVLTGLKNRRMAMSTLDIEFARAYRHGPALSVIMLDVDHFKRINDTFGHGGGDIVLQRLGVIINDSVRGTDIAGRYGGEEFLLVLPATDMEGAAILAEKLRQSVFTTVFELDDQGPQHFSISLGVATLRIDGSETVEQLLARADAALYNAKQGGRNRVECAAA